MKCPQGLHNRESVTHSAVGRVRKRHIQHEGGTEHEQRTLRRNGCRQREDCSRSTSVCGTPTRGETIRHQHHVHGEKVKLLSNIVPEAASYLGGRTPADIAKSMVFNHRPDALCVSGLVAGVSTSTDVLRQVKETVPETMVFANTGVRLDNVAAQLALFSIGQRANISWRTLSVFSITVVGRLPKGLTSLFLSTVRI